MNGNSLPFVAQNGCLLPSVKLRSGCLPCDREEGAGRAAGLCARFGFAFRQLQLAGDVELRGDGGGRHVERDRDRDGADGKPGNAERAPIDVFDEGHDAFRAARLRCGERDERRHDHDRGNEAHRFRHAEAQRERQHDGHQRGGLRRELPGDDRAAARVERESVGAGYGDVRRRVREDEGEGEEGKRVSAAERSGRRGGRSVHREENDD